MLPPTPDALHTHILDLPEALLGVIFSMSSAQDRAALWASCSAFSRAGDVSCQVRVWVHAHGHHLCASLVSMQWIFTCATPVWHANMHARTPRAGAVAPRAAPPCMHALACLLPRVRASMRACMCACTHERALMSACLPSMCTHACVLECGCTRTSPAHAQLP